MSILLSTVLNSAMPHGRMPISHRAGPQVVGDGDSNKMLISDDVDPVTWTLNWASYGSCVRITQGDVGQISFTSPAGVLLTNPLGFTKSGGRGTEIVATVILQPSLTECTWLLTGQMST